MNDYSKQSKEIVKQFRKSILEQYENGTPYQLYEDELLLFNCVKNGDLESLNNRLREMAKTQKETVGKMSKDPKKQALFTVVSGITLATRSAMSGGMPEAEAYRLSDAYLQQLPDSMTESDAMEVFLIALTDFTKRVHDSKLQGKYSLPVSKALRYISSHLHEKTSIAKIANFCQVTPQYLSKIFHKETGTTIVCYVRNEKLKIAAQMLEQSDFSIQRISTILEFPSQSAFTSQFKDYFGKTPNAYRKDIFTNI